MTDLSVPLAWDAPVPPVREKAAADPFLWPMPPFAAYGEPAPQTEPLACEIVGLNDKVMRGRLTFFVPQEAVAHVQVPPARTTLPLRFDQFRSLTLTAPILPRPPAEGDPHHALLSEQPRTEFRVELVGGGELTGATIGHLENDAGVFLFPPRPGGEPGVTRLFVPRSAYVRCDIGARIGELLLEQNCTTPAALDEAIQTQTEMRERRLGDLLVLNSVVSPDQLVEAIRLQATMPMIRVGDALLSLGMIDQAQLDQALQQQSKDRSAPLGELLVRMGAVSRADLQVALARKMGYPLVEVDNFPIEPEALQRVRHDVAQRLRLIPLLIRDRRLVVALDDPARRRAAVEEAEFHAQMKVVPVLARCRDLDAVLHEAYERIGAAMVQRINVDDPSRPIEFEAAQSSNQLVETLEREGATRVTDDDDKPIEQSDNSLVKLLNTMIIEAHSEGASDIHIESCPGREKTRIRFRKDGLLRTYLELPHNYRSAIIARVKIMCDLDISERRKPQDGKINFAKFSPQHRIELRVATIPTNGGLEDVVMRILASAKPIPLDRLGLADNNLRLLKQAVERPYGLVLCVGPTGSGKTTTLHSALSHINVPERKIWTAEDPVEITQPGLRQVQVNPKIEWTFAKALRAFLRADPDVIMVGEIRDEETAQTAVEASLTGHLVLSTLHTNSAPETVTRLLDMGCDPFNFADSLLAVLAQRLVRRLCTNCRTSRPATDAEIDELLSDHLHAWGSHARGETADDVLARWRQRHARDGRLMFHASPGCDACGGSGFKGRAGVHELMPVSRELRHLIQTRARTEDLLGTALGEGMRTLRQDGIDKVLAGVTTIGEVRATSNV